jgi:hypothetical protein
MITRLQHSQPGHTRGQAAVKGYTEQPSFCFWGCYSSQEFANQSRPGKEFCPWPQKFEFPNCLLRVPAVPSDTYQMEGLLNLGPGNPPSRKVTSNWLNLSRMECRCERRDCLARGVGNYYMRSQREPHRLLEESFISVWWTVGR